MNLPPRSEEELTRLIAEELQVASCFSRIAMKYAQRFMETPEGDANKEHSRRKAWRLMADLRQAERQIERIVNSARTGAKVYDEIAQVATERAGK